MSLLSHPRSFTLNQEKLDAKTEMVCFAVLGMRINRRLQLLDEEPLMTQLIMAACVLVVFTLFVSLFFWRDA